MGVIILTEAGSVTLVVGPGKGRAKVRDRQEEGEMLDTRQLPGHQEDQASLIPGWDLATGAYGGCRRSGG